MELDLPDNRGVEERLDRIERAVTGQTRMVAMEGETSSGFLETIVGSLEEMKRQDALAEAA